MRATDTLLRQDYPVGKREMTVDYLRDHCHLRARTDQMAATIRLRDSTMRTMQDYFTVRTALSCRYL